MWKRKHREFTQKNYLINFKKHRGINCERVFLLSGTSSEFLSTLSKHWKWSLMLNDHKVLLTILAGNCPRFQAQSFHVQEKRAKHFGKLKKYQRTKLTRLLLPSALQNILRSCIWPFVALTNPAVLTRILFCPRKLPGVYSILEIHLSLLLKCHFAFGNIHRN